MDSEAKQEVQPKEFNISQALKEGITRYCMGPILDLARGHLKKDEETFLRFEKLAKRVTYDGIRIINDTLVKYEHERFTVSQTDELLPKFDKSKQLRTFKDNSSN